MILLSSYMLLEAQCTFVHWVVGNVPQHGLHSLLVWDPLAPYYPPAGEVGEALVTAAALSL